MSFVLSQHVINIKCWDYCIPHLTNLKNTGCAYTVNPLRLVMFKWSVATLSILNTSWRVTVVAWPIHGCQVRDISNRRVHSCGSQVDFYRKWTGLCNNESSVPSSHVTSRSYFSPERLEDKYWSICLLWTSEGNHLIKDQSRNSGENKKLLPTHPKTCQTDIKL